MKRTIQIILLTWFITVNLLILIPSLYLLTRRLDGNTAGPPAQPPNPPAITTVGPLDPSLDLEKQKQQVEAYKQQIAAYAEQVKSYTQQVAAYTQQVAAFKTQLDASPDGRRRAVYELVVKGTLLLLIGSFATTLIAFVFTNVGASVVDNFIRMKNSQPPQALRMML